MTPAVYAVVGDILITHGRKRLERGTYAQEVRFTISATLAEQQKVVTMPRPQRTIFLQDVILFIVVHGTPTALTQRMNMFGTDIITSCVPCAQRSTSTSGVRCIAVPLM